MKTVGLCRPWAGRWLLLRVKQGANAVLWAEQWWVVTSALRGSLSVWTIEQSWNTSSGIMAAWTRAACFRWWQVVRFRLDFEDRVDSVLSRLKEVRILSTCLAWMPGSTGRGAQELGCGHSKFGCQPDTHQPMYSLPPSPLYPFTYSDFSMSQILWHLYVFCCAISNLSNNTATYVCKKLNIFDISLSLPRIANWSPSSVNYAPKITHVLCFLVSFTVATFVPTFCQHNSLTFPFISGTGGAGKGQSIRKSVL